MRKSLLALPAFLAIVTTPTITLAWNAVGHMVIANVAYQNLKPAVRNRIDTLVANMHEQYADVNSFEDLACWPDNIRSQKIESYTHWHYIDVAFSTDGTPLKNLIDTDNALWAVNKIEPVIENSNANPYERVRFLAFFTHIVEDLHQPLHTASYISADLPDGDRGGNDYIVIYKNNRTNLHRLWDSGLGVFDGSKSSAHVTQLANQLIAHYPKSYFGDRADDVNPEDWVTEGLENAKQVVYATPMHQPVSAAYIEKGQQLAEEEAVLAGYRLAKLLNQTL